jgi:hypothetical protein
VQPDLGLTGPALLAKCEEEQKAILAEQAEQAEEEAVLKAEDERREAEYAAARLTVGQVVALLLKLDQSMFAKLCPDWHESEPEYVRSVTEYGLISPDLP